MSNSSYRPGSSYALIHPDAVLMIALEEAGEAADLWEAIGQIPDIVALINELGRGGLSSMPPFAYVMRSPKHLQLIVRDGYVVTIRTSGGPVVVDGSGVSTWSERRLPSDEVESVQISDGSAHSSAALPVIAGVVQACEVSFDPEGRPLAQRTTGDHAVPTAAAPPEPAREVDRTAEPKAKAKAAPQPDLVVSEPEADHLAKSPSAEAAAEPAGEVTEDRADEQVEGSTPQEEPAPDRPETSPPTDTEDTEEAEDGQGDEDDEDAGATLFDPDDASFDAMFFTSGRPEPEDVPEPNATTEADGDEDAPEPEQVAPEPTPDNDSGAGNDDLDVVGDHDEHTMSPAQFAELRARMRDRGAGDQPAAPRPPRVVLSTGREAALDRSVLIGRAPQARNTTPTGLPHLLIVDDPFVSGTHLELAYRDGVVWATDFSTNGTLLRSPHGEPVPLVKGVPTVIADGTVLEVSDNLTATVAPG